MQDRENNTVTLVEKSQYFTVLSGEFDSWAALGALSSGIIRMNIAIQWNKMKVEVSFFCWHDLM